MVPAIISAAIAGITALNNNQKAKYDRQNQINDAEQALIDKRNEAQRRANGAPPPGFGDQLDDFRNKVNLLGSAPQDYSGLVGATAGIANAAYKQGQKPDAPAVKPADLQPVLPDEGPVRQDAGDAVDDALGSFDAYAAGKGVDTGGGGGMGGGVSDDTPPPGTTMPAGWEPIGSDDPAKNDPAVIARRRRMMGLQ